MHGATGSHRTSRRLSSRRARLCAAVALVCVTALLVAATPALAAGGGTLPSRYVIENVPLWQQQALGCGAASATMVMDYWTPFVDQREVYNAARTW